MSNEPPLPQLYDGVLNARLVTLEPIAAYDAILAGCWVCDAILKVDDSLLMITAGRCGDTEHESRQRFHEWALGLGFMEAQSACQTTD